MKRLFLLSISAVVAISSFAYGYSREPELPWFLSLTSIIMIVWGILEIILFFKIWGMTNDIKAIKEDHFYETSFEDTDQMTRYIRRNLLLGNIDKVKQCLLQNFISNIENAYSEYEIDDYYNERIEKRLNRSIRPYVENLKNQYDKIGEELPFYIQQMQTFRDFYEIFKEEYLKVVEEKTEENK